jgi:hypothetical protein
MSLSSVFTALFQIWICLSLCFAEFSADMRGKVVIKLSGFKAGVGGFGWRMTAGYTWDDLSPRGIYMVLADSMQTPLEFVLSVCHA